MRFQRGLIFAATLAVILYGFGNAQAAPEICGDGIDNDADGYADNGCYPTGVTGICESPLSCRETGAVAPLTGQLVYREPADLAPTVPYGPSISLQRTFMSQYDPGYNDPGDTDLKAPLGYGWHHNFMSWIKLGAPLAVDEVMLHFVTGQDVLFTESTDDANYQYYSPQVGFHFDFLRRQKSNGLFELRTLAGRTYHYGATEPLAMLTTIEDSVGNKVSLSYHDSGCYDGQLKRVTGASGRKFLEFSYDKTGGEECMLRNVELYSTDGITDTLQAEVEYLHGSTYQLTRAYRVDVSATRTGTCASDAACELARTYSYDINDKVTSIDDGDNDDVAKFYYLLINAGKIARIETSAGVVGYQYAESESSCVGSGAGSSGTCVYFHRASTTSCDADGDCASGNYCGGETRVGGGNTGACFRASRWLSISSPNEDLIDSVSSSCADCGDTDTYDWEVGMGGAKPDTLEGIQDAEGVWTMYERNSNGLVTKMVENDANPSSEPAGSRSTYYFYGNSSFPGLVTEVRRQSELKTGSCDASTTTNCKRTIYAYTSEGLLDTMQEKGFTYNSSASVVSYDFTTDYDYDSVGRITKYKGPRTDTSYDVVDYTYHSSANVLLTGYRHETKRQKATSTFITSSSEDYDRWGNAIALENANGNYTCLTYHDERNVITERRVAMNGQTSCASTHADDLTTKFTYDLGKKRTQLEKPLGNCMHTEYDSWGRVSKLKSRDDCNAGSDGDTIEYSYVNTYKGVESDDGLVVTVVYKDHGGTATYEKEMSYADSRRLASSQATGIEDTQKRYTYEDDGQIASILDTSDTEIEFEHDNFGQVDLIRRYVSGATSRVWNLIPGAEQNLPTQVEDPASLDMDWVWDDMGRKVKQVTQESGTTIYLYDPAGNMTTRIEDDGGSDEMTNTFSYDSLNRITEADYGDADCFTLGNAEIEYTYDTVTGCPTGQCDNGEGRLLKVETLIACDDSMAGDDALDQQTYYGYDYAGRLVDESIRDDGGRSADQQYEWDKNGNPTWFHAPSGTKMGWDYNDTGSSYNSDRDKPISLRRDDSSNTYITTEGYWNPFGPMQSYRQYNKKNSGYIRAEFSWDKAYRPTLLQYITESWLKVFRIRYEYTSTGNLAKRDYSYGHSSMQDSYYTYDEMERVTTDCARDTGWGCNGGWWKSDVTFNTSGDRTSSLHKDQIFGYETYDTTYVTGTRTISFVSYEEVGTHYINFGHDGRGNRTYDDDDSTIVDRRDYTYDARNNLVTVEGTTYAGGGQSDEYTMTNAYDHKNRRIFKSFYNEDHDKEEQWFFYYDVQDRLIEIKHTPDVSTSSTYSLYQYYWINDRPIAYWQIDYPSATTTKRYIHSDDQNRPLEVYSWTDSASRRWSINPELFGWDRIYVGSSLFQPLRFPGQFYDVETQSFKSRWQWARPPLHDNRYRVYDPFTGGYMQVDPLVDSTWEAYNYVSQNPVMNTDRTAGASLWEIGESAFNLLGISTIADSSMSPAACGTNIVTLLYLLPAIGSVCLEDRKVNLVHADVLTNSSGGGTLNGHHNPTPAPALSTGPLCKKTGVHSYVILTCVSSCDCGPNNVPQWDCSSSSDGLEIVGPSHPSMLTDETLIDRFEETNACQNLPDPVEPMPPGF